MDSCFFRPPARRSKVCNPRAERRAGRLEFIFADRSVGRITRDFSHFRANERSVAMYPTAYTLTVLVLTLLQYSFDKRFAKHSCQSGEEVEGIGNSTVCSGNVRRKEIRQLSRREFDDFARVFNDYSTRNDTDELNANINELGVVQIFDELLQPARMLTPYWEYRFELSLPDPTASSLWSAPQFAAIQQAMDAEWLAEFAEEERPVEDEDFFGNDPFSKLWQRRQTALKVMRGLRKTDVFWHLLLLVSIETGIDQSEWNVNRTTCMREFGRFARWTNNSCVPTVADGREANAKRDGGRRRLPLLSPPLLLLLLHPPSTTPIVRPAPTTQLPIVFPTARPITTTNRPPYSSTPALTAVQSTTPASTSEQPTVRTTEVPIPSAIPSASNETEEKLEESAPFRPSTSQIDTLDTPTVASPPLLPPTTEEARATEPALNRTAAAAQPPLNPWASKMAATTEFLAKELTPEERKDGRKGRKRKNKKNQRNRDRTTTPPPPFHDQIPATTPVQPPTMSAFANHSIPDETNRPLEAEQYGSDTLDALLVYLPTPKVPAGMIAWNARMPFRMAYFSFTIIEGSLGRNRRLKEKGHRRPKGARIYVKGLDMPSGYTQVTQGRPMKSSIAALARTLHPDNNGPFVEFKIRVENRYGVSCKQMCLDQHQRYRRCARRTVRLSPYKRFSDPIPYFDSEERAMEAQWTGKGYYRKRKLQHLPLQV
ncbi:hypothetical protein M3Y99_01495600 [Aphelenchoides fujianensis]|nr:hypothetical protein M3Y99_01495600 [Aphelenchoides fujianensis]